ncbi:hypothetical protein [Pseudomonas aeruginosa]|uniref:hypothetical protein n=1 Tax=Pseudomonas aeruginosa TaxID=287 RepID=UPI0032E42383
MNKANECTCPSGDGSLVHPCPAHPAEQAGGDERAAFELFVRKHCGMPEHIAVNWDAKFTNDAWEGWQARAALAQPSPVRSSLLINGYQLRAALDFIAPDGTAEQLESEACIEWRQQDADFLEAGLYAFCAEYPEEGGVLLDEEPTNSQPSPAQELAERGTQHRFSTTEQTCRHDFAGVWWNDNGETKTGKECRECGFFIADIAEAAELERPEVVGYLATAEHPKHGQPHKAFNYFKDQHDAQVAHWRERGCTVTEDRLMTVAQHERIVGALRYKAELYDEVWALVTGKGYMNVTTAISVLESERDAALARVAKLEHSQSFQRDIDYSVLSEYADKHRLHFNNLCAVVRSALIALPAQAQHSVPGKYDDVLLPFLKSMEHELHANAGKGDRPGWLQMDRKTALLEIYYHLGKLQKATKGNDTAGIVEYAADVANMSMMLVDVCGLLADAPGKEGV